MAASPISLGPVEILSVEQAASQVAPALHAAADRPPAIVHAEPGADLVRASLSDAIISTVNYSEVLKKAIELGVPIAPLVGLVHGASLDIIPFDGRLLLRALRSIRKRSSTGYPLPTVPAWRSGFSKIIKY